MTKISDDLPPSSGGAPSAERTWCEKLAQNAWGAYMTEIETRALLAASTLAGPPGTALELGCDGGRWSILLHQQGWSNVCTDIVPGSVGTCQGRLPEAKCILVDPADSRLPVADASIDLLLVYEAPPVVEASWFPAEARRALRKDGVLLSPTSTPVPTARFSTASCARFSGYGKGSLQRLLRRSILLRAARNARGLRLRDRAGGWVLLVPLWSRGATLRSSHPRCGSSRSSGCGSGSR